jgi:hypothetical protein
MEYTNTNMIIYIMFAIVGLFEGTRERRKKKKIDGA